MTFKEAITTCLVEKYINASGRARRSEYWYFALFTTLVTAILNAVFDTGSVIVNLVTLALLIPEITSAVRRLHDTGKSWTYLLMSLIPIAGIFILLAQLAKDSVPGANEYGPNPKGVGGTGESFVSEQPWTAPAETVSSETPWTSAPAESTTEYTSAKEVTLDNYTDPYDSPFSKENVAKYATATAAAATQARYCSYCGKPVADGQKFCTECGAPVEQ